MEKHLSLIEEMPFFETFHSKGKAIIDTEAFEKWIHNFRNINFAGYGDKDSFNYKIRLLREAMKDNFFADDLNDISSDFQVVDSEGWE